MIKRTLEEKINPESYRYKIEDGVPYNINKKRRRNGAYATISDHIPWNLLKVGQSVFIPATDFGSEVSIQSQLSSYISTRKRTRPGKVFACHSRDMEHDGEVGWRVWRLA